MKRSLWVALLTAAIETVGFLLWLRGIAQDQALLGLLVFDAILILEHVVQAAMLTGRVRPGPIVVFSQLETFVVWGTGLAIGNALNNLPAAALWWAAGLTVEHTLTDNVLRDRPLFSRVWDVDNLLASAVEAVGGLFAILVFPVSLLGAIVAWFIPNSIEHALLDARVLKELGLVALLLLFALPAQAQSSHYRHRDGWIVQDSVLTPGAVRTTDPVVICQGTTKTVRKTTAAMKEAVYREYGIVGRYVGQFEIDHLIPLELGGKDTVVNLWPEPAKPLPGFHQKDVLENFFHAQICSGAISADSAQRWIVHDFPGAYRAMVKAKAAAP